MNIFACLFSSGRKSQHYFHVLWSDVCCNRPSVLVILIKDGDVSLLLSNVAINDSGTYECLWLLDKFNV